MPNALRRAVVALAAVAMTAGLSATGLAPATAAPAGCRHIRTVGSSKLPHCVRVLRLESESAGRRAERADEAYLVAKQASDSAQHDLDVTAAAAGRAETIARRSQTQAGLVTARLTHSGGSVGQTAEVLLSNHGASRMLYHLSRMSELGTDTGSLVDDAKRDEAAAEQLRTAAGLAAERLTSSEQRTKAAFEHAKDESDAAQLLVRRAEAKQTGTAPVGRVHYIDLPSDAPKAARVVAFARSQIGKPYVFGGAGPAIWDCSGLTMMAMQSIGIPIGGHSSNAQYRLAATQGLLVPYSAAQPGDLVFYGSGDVYHVAVYSGGGEMVEAPHPGASVREVPVRMDDLAPMVARFTG